MESVEDVVLGEGVSASGAATEEELLGLDDHSWLQWYQKSWLDIHESVDGRLVTPHEEGRVRPSRNYATATDGSGGIAVKKGLIRFVFVIIDLSSAMRQTDFKPSRSDFIVSEISEFIRQFFASNPLSYISLIAMRDGQAHFITRINGQPNFQIKKLKSYIQNNQPAGTCSLVKALDLVIRSGETPMYATREVLVLWGSLSTVDPSQTPVHPYLTDRISTAGGLDITVLSLSPEVYAVKKVASRNFFVAQNATDFREKLNGLLTPVKNAQAKPLYIKMGFPVKSFGTALTKCSCHLELHTTLYTCPQCKSVVCEIPTNCPVCKLTLVEKDMLTRIHRLLYDMPPFTEISVPRDQQCNSCYIPIGDTFAVQCQDCSEVYCYDCDLFSHKNLRHCVGCLARG
jgi:transcription initiation factor TFIIH subunit 2